VGCDHERRIIKQASPWRTTHDKSGRAQREAHTAGGGCRSEFHGSPSWANLGVGARSWRMVFRYSSRNGTSRSIILEQGENLASGRDPAQVGERLAWSLALRSSARPAFVRGRRSTTSAYFVGRRPRPAAPRRPDGLSSFMIVETRLIDDAGGLLAERTTGRTSGVALPTHLHAAKGTFPGFPVGWRPAGCRASEGCVHGGNLQF